MQNIDGNLSLANQEAAIRGYEAAADKLLGFAPLMDGTEFNGVSFVTLDPGTQPKTINLTTGAVPPGGTLVCFATIYVNGNLTPVSAYR